jgi:hypothetical protein
MAIRESGQATGKLQTGRLAAAKAAEAPARLAAKTGELKQQPGVDENEKAHTDRLQAVAAKTHLGALPWEAGGGAAAGIMAGEAFTVAKNARSVQKKIEDVRAMVKTVRSRFEGAKAKAEPTGGGVKAPKLNALGKFDAGVRIVGGVNSAVKLVQTVKSLRNGANVDNVNGLVKNTVGVIRGVDGAVKLWKNGKDLAMLATKSSSAVARMVGSKLNPALTIASAATTLVETRKNIANWHNLKTSEKIQTITNVGSAIADVVGIVFPPAKAVSAGLSLVSMAIGWFS